MSRVVHPEFGSARRQDADAIVTVLESQCVTCAYSARMCGVSDQWERANPLPQSHLVGGPAALEQDKKPRDGQDVRPTAKFFVRPLGMTEEELPQFRRVAEQATKRLPSPDNAKCERSGLSTPI